jgi:hypothetical protein
MLLYRDFFLQQGIVMINYEHNEIFLESILNVKASEDLDIEKDMKQEDPKDKTIAEFLQDEEKKQK